MRFACLFHSLFVFAVLALEMMGTMADDGARLVLKEHSAENIEGYYHRKKGLALHFVINETFVELKSGDGSRTLVHFRDLQNGKFLFQILDDVFLGKKSSKFPVHLKLNPRRHSNLQDLQWEEIFDLTHDHRMTNSDSFAENFYSALDRLKNTTEHALLHSLSTELETNVENRLPLMRFHMLAMTLASKYSSNSSNVLRRRRRWSSDDGQYKEGELKFEHVSRSSVQRAKITVFQEDSKKSCQDLKSDPNPDDCLGMCGYGCKCWYYVCGNCCRNQLCFEHDECCRHEMYSVNCLIPLIHTMSCENGYGGYPSCLN